jgi:hypothetical protein
MMTFCDKAVVAAKKVKATSALEKQLCIFSSLLFLLLLINALVFTLTRARNLLYYLDLGVFSLTCRLDSLSKRSATGLKCFGGECGGFLGLGARLNQLILYVV